MKKLLRSIKLIFTAVLVIGICVIAYTAITTMSLIPDDATLPALAAASESGTSEEDYTSLEEIPHYLAEAVISIEDRRFPKHPGIDVMGMARAIYINISRRDLLQGASTITQQLARNLLLNQDRTFDRKLREILLALKLEKIFTKEEILEAYLNIIYMGPQTYGIEAASHLYFGKSAAALKLHEAALLAGVIQNPGLNSPLQHEEKAIQRAGLVLQSMEEEGYITAREKELALNQPYIFNPAA